MFLLKGAQAKAPAAPTKAPTGVFAKQGKGGTADKTGFAALLGSMLGEVKKLPAAQAGPQAPAKAADAKLPKGAEPTGRPAQGAKDQASSGRVKADSTHDTQDQGRLSVAAAEAAATQARTQKARGPDPDPARAEAQDAGAKTARTDQRRRKGDQEPDAQAAAAAAAGGQAPRKLEARDDRPPAGAERAEADISAKDKRKERAQEPKFGLIDLRTGAEKAAEAPKRVEASAEAAPKPGEGTSAMLSFSDPQKSAPDAIGRPAEGQSFASMLSRQLEDGLGADIVRQAVVVLHGADKGTIRLQLRPESLGAVRVQISMEDSTLSGKITVDTLQAKEAFERSLPHLAQAFEAAGFEAAKLEISLNSGAAHSENQGRGAGGDGPYWSERLVDDAGAAGSAGPRAGGPGANPWGRRLDLVM